MWAWRGGLGTRLWRRVEGLVIDRPSCAILVCCPQLRQRFELEIERMKQMHQKDREDQEEELEDVRQSCQKRVRELWPQCTPSPSGEDAETRYLEPRGMLIL